MKSVKTFVLLLFCAFFCGGLTAQNSDQFDRAALMKELDKRNIKYEDLEARLIQEGYDIDSLDIKTMSLDEREHLESILQELSDNAPEISDVNKENETETDQTQELIVEDQSTVKKELASNEEIYGQNLFRNGVLGIISNSNQIKAPESYVLGSGDQLVISIWGDSQIENNYTIQNDGYIRILDGKMRVFLKGLNLAKARTKLKRILSNEYRFSDGEFELTVNYSRTVRIAIYGEVFNNPGSFTISGFNSAFNALSLVGGPSNIGSLRNIKLQKSNGKTLELDVYKFMKDPSIQSEFYLEDNDIILVPVLDKLVSINGSVRREHKYELKQGEGLRKLLEYAGGFSENAYLKKIQIKRYQNNEQRIIDIDWTQYTNSEEDFSLMNGDEILVENIEQAFRNFVSITGELEKPGQYERSAGMRVSDLVDKAGLTPDSNTEIIYLVRTRTDGTSELYKLNLDEIMSDRSNIYNLVLNDRDKLEVWSQERFTDEASISVAGAVRYHGQYPYDGTGSLKVVDAIMLAGGLRRDASSFATIHYNDPLNKKQKYYKTIDNLYELFEDPDHSNNFILSPFDSLVVQSLNEYEESTYVRVEGAVNAPGLIQFGSGMTIKDLLIMAGGFKKDAKINNIEVSRVIIENNQPTQVIVAQLEMNRDFDVLSKGVANGEYRLEPFDNIAVRFVREFYFQERIFMIGEIEVPGPYALYEDNLKISDMINRAGGLTGEAFPEGATLVRNDKNLGSVIIKLDEIIRNPQSEFNLVLKDGDEITVPKISELVTIRGATKVKEVFLDENVAEFNLIRVPYFEGKNAHFYIDQFAGGFDENADKRKVFVEYANGEIKQSKMGIFKRRYPKVRKGSVITVGYKEPEVLDDSENSKTDWTKVLTDSVGQALSILTLILLIQKVD